MGNLRDQCRQYRGQGGLRLVEPPARAIWLPDRIREHAHLDRRHTRESGRAEYRVALHRLDLAAARAADAGARPDCRHLSVRQRPACGVDQRRVSGETQVDPGRVVGVAVHGFAPNHECGGRERLCASEPNVDDCCGSRPGERRGGASSGVDGTDAAHELLGAVRPT